MFAYRVASQRGGHRRSASARASVSPTKPQASNKPNSTKAPSLHCDATRSIVGANFSRQRRHVAWRAARSDAPSSHRSRSASTTRRERLRIPTGPGLSSG